MSHGRFLPPDYSRGDETTVGGYAAVHGRAAALEGKDGLSYSLELLTDDTGDPARPFGAYLVFLQWRRIGEQGIDGHLETDFIAYAQTAPEALALAAEIFGQFALRLAQRRVVCIPPPLRCDLRKEFLDHAK